MNYLPIMVTVVDFEVEGSLLTYFMQRPNAFCRRNSIIRVKLNVSNLKQLVRRAFQSRHDTVHHGEAVLSCTGTTVDTDLD